MECPRCKLFFKTTNYPLIYSCQCPYLVYINGPICEPFKQPGFEWGRTLEDILEEINNAVCESCNNPLTKMVIHPYFKCDTCHVLFIVLPL